ncbi:acid phosphatase [Pseudoxanthomonas sp.]|uniref:acid phosphatase n=1 Tax=Pseudoxanthomonas sp. TaxID=1871049 RepID=UPI002608B4D6|nr:acid phosphatase [Pseudoxanthomonas sp.]WDS35102.1 MAG: acid phosphatase [Pseudoxanthomonas sp.]
MSQHDDTPDSQSPSDPQRRRLLGGLAAAGAALAAGGEAIAGTTAKAKMAGTARATPTAVTDAQLGEHIDTVVVLYAENRSFNNLFADFPGLQQPLKSLDPARSVQHDRDGQPFKTLPPIWGGMVPDVQVVNHRSYQVKQDDVIGLPNAPFELKTLAGEPLPHGVVTRDLVHEFYRNQMQINGGRNDGFVAWGDSGALLMGHYGDAAVNLRLWRLAEQYTLCDNFFMGAFGGSFFNHQYLVAAQPPFYPDADKGPAKLHIAVTASGTAEGNALIPAEGSPASAMDGVARFTSRPTLTPDFWAVNTIGPAYSPGFNVDKHDPALADASSPNTLPPQQHKHIGDMLSAKGVDWAWYGGAFQAALDGVGDSNDGSFPSHPNFQPHHQPLNYFVSLAPGTAARKQHLRDGGLGETAATNRFLADAAAGKLPAVSYYKPQGNLNMHAGYSDVEAGDRHLARIVHALQNSPQWKRMLIVITVDENGGWWDHVSPPKGDRWGPGTRIPALIVSPFAKRGHVDHTIYDTGSIARFITRRWGLEKLPGLKLREDAMVAAGGPPPGDLTGALDFSRV